MNPNIQKMIQMAQMMKSVRDPKSFISKAAKQSGNPMLSNLVNMAEKGDDRALEQFGRNFFKEKGLDFDEHLNIFKSLFK